MLSILRRARRTNATPETFSPLRTALLLPLVLALSLLGSAAQAQVDVTATAGTLAASYTTLKGAFDAVNAGTHQGVITMGISADTTETAPAVLNASGAGAAVYTTIAISPTGGAARTISGAIVAGSPLIDLNGADNVTIDGLNSGGNSLTIANTTVSATSGTVTIRFIGGATNNIITNSNLQGSSSSSVATNGGTIFFSTDAVTANGNDNNTISNNNIGPAGANLPSKAILCNGSTTTTALGNSGNIVNNNNIFDYFAAAVTSAGVAANGGCNTWTITNNRFYQTGTRTWTTGALHNAINIANTTATSGAQGFTITGNIIGFASNTQTGTYTLTGSTGKFAGIVFNGITAGTLSNISSNTVAAVSMTGVTSSGTSTASPFMGILVTNGVANTNSNIFGSQTGTGSLTFSTNTTTNTEIYGIFNFSVDNWTANSNNFGSITASNAGATGTFLFYVMRANTGSGVAFNAASNLIGGTTANSIQNTSTSTAAQLIGMQTPNARVNWTTNTIRNLTGAGGTGTTTAASVIGMVVTATTANPHLVSQNVIHTLTNTSAAAATTLCGIQYSGSATGANTVSRNFIHSFTAASATAILNGINVGGGTTTYANNMIRLGVDAAGTDVTTGLAINGISEPLGTDNFFHNSVYVGGAAVGGASNTFAFNSSQVTVARSYLDNIFVNARSNGAGTGKHYAVRVGGTAPNPAGLTVNANVYQATGTGGVFGLFNALDVANLAAWRVAVGQDAGSIYMDPVFLTPNGTAATVDLHINPAVLTPIEGNGLLVAAVTDDFDGQLRSGLTPVDIGADAGNFLGIDLAPPGISYTALANTALTTNRTLTATLTDITGVATGGLAPRIYYRKGVGAYFSQACSLASGTVNSGTWNCVINNADLGGVVLADVISYFVIAQDTVGNIASNPGGATASDVNTVTVPPAAPNTYTIVPGLSGSLNVGAAETYTSLTNVGGLFEAINGAALSSNLVINITSDLTTELGTNALNQWGEDGVGGYTVLIRPQGAPRTVSGTNAGSLIRLNGVDRLTIDGSTTGGTAVGIGGDPLLRELTFQNTNVGTSAVVMTLQTGTNGAQNNVIKNVVILGQDPTTTLAGLALGGNTPGTAGTDNDNNRVENVAVKRSIYGIYSAGFGAANPNLGTVITRNDLSAAAADRVRRVGIVVFNDDGVQITENSIGSMSTNESADGVGIGVGAQAIDTTSVTSGGVTNALVARNKIDGVASLSTTGFSAAGIAVAGGTTGPNTIVNNMIDGVTAPATSPDIVAGIWVAGVVGSTTRVYDNTVALSGDRGTVASQIGSYAIAITGTNPTVELKGNIFANSQTTTGGGVNAKSYAIGMTSSTFGNLDSNFNDLFASGASAGFFRTGSIDTTGTDLATLGAWQAAVSDDANSLAVDPLLTSATNLHLTAASPMLNAGTSIAGVTVDHDGDPRPLVTPDIGADEIVAGILAFSSATYADSESAGTTTITVTRTGGSAGSVSIDYATVAGGTATGGASCGGSVDFVNTSGTLTFGDTIVSQTFTVTLCPDSLNEANETVNLALSNPLGGSIMGTPNTAVLTINDDDPAPTISITDVTQAELNASTSLFGFVASLSAPSGQTVTVHVQTADGTATIANNDYVAVPDTILTFNPGVTIANVDVTVNGDTAPETNETFFVNLATATNASILDNQGVGTITNDDASSGPVTVTATAGTPGPTDYATLKAAFDAINAGTHQGAITIDVNGNTTETATAALNNSGAGAALYTSVAITPSGGLRTISGTIVGAIVKLNGADNVTIDGRIAGTGRNLAILNGSNTAASAAVWLASVVAGNGATNNVIRNLELACGPTNTNANATFGIIMSGTTISATSNGTDNDNNQFLFNRIIRARYGIVTRGTTTNLNIAPIVTDNIVGPTAFGPDQIGKTGIFMQADTGGIVARNTIQFVGGTLATTTAGADRLGIALGSEAWSVAAATTLTSNTYTVTQNVIHDIVDEQTFSAVGIESATTGGGSPTNNLIANNFIYNVRANGTNPDQPVGIGIVGGHTDQVVYNSIAITGDQEPGAAAAPDTFGNAIRLAVASGANHANMSLVGNSIYLDASSTPAGVHYYAITAPSAAYAFGTGAENFNNVYINPGNAQLRTGGFATAAGAAATTEFATLANWQAAYTVPQDANSIQANPAYASPTSDLHLLGASPNINVGTPVGSVTVDIDNEARPNGAGYDIGADEFYATPGALQLSSASYVGNEGTTLVVTVNRVSGNSGAVGATATLSNGSASGGAACTAGVDFINPGPQILSFADSVITQQFNVTLCTDAPVADPGENFTITLSLPTGGATIGSPAVATASIVDIAAPFSGPFTVGSGGNYPSLTNPGGIFEAINLAGVAGNTTINIISDLAGETGVVPLNEAAGGFTITIKPSGVARVISGSSATQLIKLSGADNVTIDGSLAAGTDRSLTLTNSGIGPLLWIATNATSGATGNTLKNCNLIGPGALTGQGVIAGSGATFGGAAEFPNSNNTIQNNSIKSVQNAAFISGNVASFDQNWTITGNDFGSTVVAEKLAFRGMLLGGAANFTISNNNISGVSSGPASTATMSGIQLSAAINGGSITGNRISDIKHNNAGTTTSGSNGIFLAATSTASNVLVANNFISDIASPGTTGVLFSSNGYGIAVASGGGYTVVHNSVLMNTNQGVNAATGNSAAVNVSAGLAAGALDLRDNVLANIQTLGTRFAVIDSSAAAVFSAINFNDYFAQNVGSLGGTQTTLANWQTATGQDANSLAVDPLFVTTPAPANLHLQATSPMLNAGVAVATVTVDIDNDPRPPATPDIGADEIVQADLSITKTDGVGTVSPGGSTTYTIVASNAGANNVTGATVADTIPAFLTCNWTCSGTLGGTCTASGSGNINDTVNLPAGGSVTYTLSCTVSISATGSIANTATVSSAVADPNAGNNSATDNDTVVPVTLADVAITKTDGSATEIPGTSVVYTIVATNTGPSAAPTVTIVDNFTASLSGCSTTCVASAGSSCTAGPVAGNINDVANLLNGGTATYTATCNISATATGALVNTATAAVSGGVTDPASGNNSATDNDTLVPTADVSITKTDGSTTATPGSPVTYTITVANAGPSAAPTVGVLDLFPASLTSCATTCVGAGGGSCTAGPVVGNVNETANLPVGGSATYTASCTVSLSATGTVVNTATATVNGGGTDPNTANNSATDTDTVGNTIFNDGFESGDTLQWSATVPLTFGDIAVLGVGSGSTDANFSYDFAAVRSGEAFQPTAIAVVTDATGKPLFLIGARRSEPNGELELTLAISGAGRSAWVPVSEVGQQVRIEWTLADESSLGRIAVSLDGLVVLAVEDYSGTAAPAAVKLLHSAATVAP